MLQAQGGFASLDLSNAKVSSGLSVLGKGTHDVYCKEASYEKNSQGQFMVKAVLEAVDGSGQITHNFNVHSNSDKAREIARDQLKTFLHHGGHPNPDNPGAHPQGIKSLNGIKARIYVDSEGTYEKNGRTYESVQVRRFMALNAAPVQPRNEIPHYGQGPTTPTSNSLDVPDDEIPF